MCVCEKRNQSLLRCACEEAGELPPLLRLQVLEKSLKELRPLKVAKSAILIWLHFGLCEVEAKLVNNKEVKYRHRQWHHY